MSYCGAGCFLASILYNTDMGKSVKVDEKKIKKGAEKLGIRMVVIFGSQASGKAGQDSDYDIAVLTSGLKGVGESMDYYNDVLFFLRDALSLPDYKIDLTDMNNASPDLNYEIFRNGCLIYGDLTEFAAFQAYAMRERIATRGLRELREKLIHIRQKKIAEKIYA